MMNTPICDFLDKYADTNPKRLHMPGHKGQTSGFFGVERYDITEVSGADSLYSADGIIKESERNAAEIFDTAATFYSTEGSSHCIRAMLYLASLHAQSQGLPKTILAGRNAHKTFITAAGLLGFEADWIQSCDNSLLSGDIAPADIKKMLESKSYAAVYITSPDYLGGMADISAISKVCREHNTLFLVDNAHGAYLRFLKNDIHPIALGADICCDSAHKTLPVITGGAYLHFADSAKRLIPSAKNALSVFGSTSPSYLILRSLDMANKTLSGNSFAYALGDICSAVDNAKAELSAGGYKLFGTEPLKITIMPKSRGYTGEELSCILQKAGFYCEFADRDYIVFMISPGNKVADISSLCKFLLSIPAREAVSTKPPDITPPPKILAIRDALLAESELLPIKNCLGRICAAPTVSCPPAVPIAACGELIDDNAISAMEYYGITECLVIKE